MRRVTTAVRPEEQKREERIKRKKRETKKEGMRRTNFQTEAEYSTFALTFT